MNAMLRTLIGALILGAGLVVAPPTAVDVAWAQDTTAQDQSLRALRERIEERYRVLSAQGGVALIPLYETDVGLIELTEGGIALDGDPVTGAELSDALGDDAAAILRLSYLDPTTRRVLFGIGEPPVTADTLAADTTAAGEPVEPGEPDEPRERRDRREGVGQGDRVRVGGSVRIEEDEFIAGDVVAIGGSATVQGEVSGDVTAIGGSVHLGPEAVVDGDVTSVGGQVHKSATAVVHGSIEETRGPDIRIQPQWGGMDSPFEGVGGFVTTVVWILFLIGMACLAYLLARRPVERMEYRVGSSAWKAAAVGLAAQILFFPALVLTVVVLAVSVIGIPLLIGIPFALLALCLGTLVGFAAVAKRFGHAAEERFGWAHENPYMAVAVGVGLIMAVSFFASALGMAGGPLEVFAVILGILGFVLQYVAWTVGLGALLLTRFGTRYAWDGEGGPTAPAAPAGATPPAGRTSPPGESPATEAPAPPPPPEGGAPEPPAPPEDEERSPGS